MALASCCESSIYLIKFNLFTSVNEAYRRYSLWASAKTRDVSAQADNRLVIRRTVGKLELSEVGLKRMCALPKDLRTNSVNLQVNCQRKEIY